MSEGAKPIELPLFPLSVVLFPGQTLPLHIFEPRYRIMIQKCIDEEMPFGVLLADEGDASTYSVGTTARITNVNEFPDGHMDILVVGSERFIVDKIRTSADEYLVGDALMYPFNSSIKPKRELAKSVSTQLKDYLKLVANLGGIEFRYDSFPKESTGIAVFAAIALQLPLEDKQELLATETVSELLNKELKLLKDELFTLRLMVGAPKPPKPNDAYAFSMN